MFAGSGEVDGGLPEDVGRLHGAWRAGAAGSFNCLTGLACPNALPPSLPFGATCPSGLEPDVPQHACAMRHPAQGPVPACPLGACPYV
jgi:hypothetical protein